MKLPSRTVADQDCQLNWQKLEPAIHSPGLVTALPTTPYDGQVIFFDTGTDGVVWQLRHDAGSGSAYKWQFVGGAALWSSVDALETTASTIYAALATAGPLIAVPLAGEFDIQHGAVMYNNGASNAVWMSYDVGGTGAVDSDSVVHQEPSAGNLNVESLARIQRRSLSTAVTLTSKYKASAGTGSFQRRWMRVTPVRVG